MSISRNRKNTSVLSPANRNRAIIYCRKSTDRDDKQQNSLESQENASLRTLKEKDLELVEIILESASAKEEWKRPNFARMLEMCRSGKVDYIIVDEVSRLTRNAMDWARILWLLEKWQILAVHATSRSYYSSQANDHFMLQLDAWIAKLDNDLRKRNVKARMITCAEKWQILGKAPFGYRNTVKVENGVVIGKNVSIDVLEAEMVRKIYDLRVNHRATLKEISITCKKEFWNRVKHSFNQQSIKKILNNKFYIWVYIYSGKDYKGSYEPIIDKGIFYDAQDMGQARVNNSLVPNEDNNTVQYYLKWFIKDENNISLTAQIKKGKHIYYNNQNLRSDCKVNISQNEIFRQAEEFFEKNQISSHMIAWVLYYMVDIVLKDSEAEAEKRKVALGNQIQIEKTRKEKLLEWYLNWIIDDETYRKKDMLLFDVIMKLEYEIENLPKSEINEIKERCKKELELPEAPYVSLKWKTDAEKAEIMKTWMLELIVDNKKALNFVTIEGLEVLAPWYWNTNYLSTLNDGNATENRTPITGMRIPCPNR